MEKNHTEFFEKFEAAIEAAEMTLDGLAELDKQYLCEVTDNSTRKVTDVSIGKELLDKQAHEIIIPQMIAQFKKGFETTTLEKEG